MTGRPRRKTSVRRNRAAIIQDRAEAENDPQREEPTQLWASHKTVVCGLAWSTRDQAPQSIRFCALVDEPNDEAEMFSGNTVALARGWRWPNSEQSCLVPGEPWQAWQITSP
jgi:hypothetical protein